MRQPSKTDSLRFLIESGLPVGTILDVGVQECTAELIACFPSAQHILFEPDTNQRETIHRNYAGIDHVLVEAAVTATSGFLHVAKDGSTGAGLAAFRPAENVPTLTIPAVSLDDWVAEHPVAKPYLLKVAKPYLLKVDVDGGEIEVLRGATRTLADTSCVAIEAPMHVLADRLGVLLQAGFALWDIVDLCYYHGNLSQVDLVCVSYAFRANLPDLRPWETKEFRWDAWQSLMG